MTGKYNLRPENGYYPLDSCFLSEMAEDTAESVTLTTSSPPSGAIFLSTLLSQESVNVKTSSPAPLSKCSTVFRHILLPLRKVCPSVCLFICRLVCYFVRPSHVSCILEKCDFQAEFWQKKVSRTWNFPLQARQQIARNHLISND